MLYQQIIGRGLRKAEGKADCLVLDHSDTTLRLGFITDIEWGPLDDGQPNATNKRGRDTIKPQQCFECHALMPKGERLCPECGHKVEVISKVRVGDGELVELSRAKATIVNQQRWFSQLLWVAQQQGYEHGWVAHTFRRKFGQWPRGLDEVPMHAGPEVRKYVRHLPISHAKTRSGRDAA